MSQSRLETHIHISSEQGLSSISTLITGSASAVLIDPPFLIPDANSVVEWIRKTTPKPLTAVFSTHHHPDHYFSANPILDAFPDAKFYAAPYVCAGIDREYDEKVKYWPTVVGAENVPKKPRKPEPYRYSFLALEGDETSPVILLGPVQGDCVDHTLFWLPTERTLICGDAIYGCSTHVWVEEVENEKILRAWQSTLTLIRSLRPTKLIPGHLEQGWALGGEADLDHNVKYLQLVSEKLIHSPKKYTVDELFEMFKDAFPQATKNLDFFLGHLANRFGVGGKGWEENHMHGVHERNRDQLEGWRFEKH